MSQYDGPDLKCQDPFLLPGEKWIIAQFHNESCFHANEFKQSACEGDIVHDAQVIIHPGAAGNPYWDMKQLLAQVEVAISIFNASHPDCQALFIFNQSSAHALLSPNALHAFDMNKANGGKQHIQKDTVIPGNAPNPAMTTGMGVAKGLQQVLEECGFNTSGIHTKCAPVCPFENNACCLACILSKQGDFVDQISMLEDLISKAGHLCMFLPKFHCELNPIEMYWGYAKYRYHEIFKTTFADAKAAAQSCLDACPLDTIWCFIN
ncbi:hypothetical protein BS47DRAFT_1374469 [Hydnum rufescens UP504]|uniref:Tc1-like transposase DDE domain-containing protein n=1 Tax=Hydnum rufescens UP504 TaxID=1448309 RepID=A0A9P6AD98_9AGAM|nr:hypothetical protein BS47DRAFT_1374469 [Hydnum rufescens UP504]